MEESDEGRLLCHLLAVLTMCKMSASGSALARFRSSDLCDNPSANRIAKITEPYRSQKAAANVLEEALLKAGDAIQVDWEDLTARPDGITERSGSRVLSDKIYGLMYPREETGELFHYTDMKGFRGIVGKGVLRLTQLSKRMDDNEIRAHAKQHGWDGYNGETADGLAKDLFYTSFTRTAAGNDDEMWRKFGDHGFGVRLRFGVIANRDQSHRGELRGVKYLDGTKTLLNLIEDGLKDVDLPKFIPWSASRMTAFGLTEDYDGEAEVRLLVKDHQGVPHNRKNEGGYDFWEVPINKENDVASVRLLGVEVGRQHTDLTMIEDILKASDFGHIIPTTAIARSF